MADWKKSELHTHRGDIPSSHQDTISRSSPSSKYVRKTSNPIFISSSSSEDGDAIRYGSKSVDKSVSSRSVKQHTFEDCGQSPLAEYHNMSEDKCSSSPNRSNDVLHEEIMMNNYNKSVDKLSLTADVRSGCVSLKTSPSKSLAKPLSFLFPNLLEQLFQKYERVFKEEEQQQETTFERLKNQLLVELDVFFGEVLTTALQLLDKGATITLHRSSEHPREIAEIELKRFNSLQLVYLYPNVNYCRCVDFKHWVLGLQPHPALSLSSETAVRRYTCAHVLLLRLAQLLHLHAPVLQTKVHPSHEFKWLLKKMQLTSK